MASAAWPCPYCGVWLRVAVQPSKITKSGPDQLTVEFNTQVVAHICKGKHSDVPTLAVRGDEGEAPGRLQ
jgi:hypothetical protein